MIDVLTYFTLNSLAYFTGYFSGNYGLAAIWIFGFHTMWCMTFGDLTTMTIGNAPRDINFTKAWGIYLLNIFVWAWGGANLRDVMRGIRFLDGSRLKDEHLGAKRYNLATIAVFLVYFVLYAAAHVLLELKVIGAAPLGGLLTLAALVIVTFVFYAAVGAIGRTYYPEMKVLRQELGFYLLWLMIYGIVFVFLDAADFDWGKFDQWHTRNLNGWISLGFGGAALIVYPIIMSRLLHPASRSTKSDTETPAKLEGGLKSHVHLMSYVRLPE